MFDATLLPKELLIKIFAYIPFEYFKIYNSLREVNTAIDLYYSEQYHNIIWWYWRKKNNILINNIDFSKKFNNINKYKNNKYIDFTKGFPIIQYDYSILSKKANMLRKITQNNNLHLSL